MDIMQCILLYCMVLYCIICIVWYCTVLYCAVLYCIIQRFLLCFNNTHSLHLGFICVCAVTLCCTALTVLSSLPSFAPWCPACQAFGSTWARFTEWSQGKDVRVVQVDVDAEVGLSAQFIITALPSVYQ